MREISDHPAVAAHGSRDLTRAAPYRGREFLAAYMEQRKVMVVRWSALPPAPAVPRLVIDAPSILDAPPGTRPTRLDELLTALESPDGAAQQRAAWIDFLAERFEAHRQLASEYDGAGHAGPMPASLPNVARAALLVARALPARLPPARARLLDVLLDINDVLVSAPPDALAHATPAAIEAVTRETAGVRTMIPIAIAQAVIGG